MADTNSVSDRVAEAPRAGWQRRGGLFRKFIISMVGLVAFVLIVNGAVETWFIYRGTAASLLGALSEKAESTGRRIELSLSDIERHISWVTRASVAGLDQRRLDHAELLEQVPAIEEIVQVDSSGHEQLRSRRGSFQFNGGVDFSRDPSFVQALGRNVWWSPVYFRGQEPFAFVAMAHLGHRNGVTIAQINLRFLSGFVNASQTGTADSAYLVDQAGRLLAHSDPGQALGADLSGLPQVASAMPTRANAAVTGKDRGGSAVLAAYAPIPQLHAFVFYEQPRSRAFAPVYDMLTRAGFLLALGLLLASAAGTLLARKMVVPIRQLQAGARELGAKEFGHRIDVQTGDEVEELADHFNRMAGQLQESYSGLEQKVEERTRDLAQTISELTVLEETGRAINSSLDLDAVLATILANAVKITQADAGLIYGYDSNSGVLELAQSCGIEPLRADAAHQLRIAGDNGVMSAAIRTGEPVFVPDFSASCYSLENVPLLAGAGAILVVPLAGQDEIVGALAVQSNAGGALTSDKTGLMRTFAHQAVLAIQNARLFREIDRKGRELRTAHDLVQHQAEKLKEQTGQLEAWNQLLEDRVAKQLAEIERIGRLERFLAPQLAQVIASSGEDPSLLASHRREVTVVFCDLRGFTAFTESAEPEEVMRVLREYHASLGEIIFQYEGTLDRFAGDGILILFNDPIPCADHTQRAVRMAVEMRDNIGRLSEKWRGRGHFLGFGIGIALGYATLGQVGFDRRLEYAAVGTVTNLASRLCDEAKPGQIIISQRAFGIVEPWVKAAPIGELKLKGFSRPMAAYEILAWREDAAFPGPSARTPAPTLAM
ncbi:MAG: GAF domain-containing protein [Methylocapsa sp.]|nr:GAF domain-containing protein [Methylocapsa sp.]